MSHLTHGDSCAAGSQIERRRERQRRDARRALLDATEELVIESDGTDFSIRRLGQRSGYSAPTVYHYFGDKDGLIDALLEERISRLASQLEEVASTEDPRRDLRAILLAYYAFSCGNPTFSRLMWTLSRKGESRLPPAMERVKRCIEAPLARYAEQAKLGEFDAETAGWMLWAQIYGLVSLQLMEPDRKLGMEIAERALDTLFLGMAGMNDRELENGSE
jgi:AcrR family transcriptional regulator